MVWRGLTPAVAALFILTGAVFARFGARALPASYLARPLIAALFLSVIIGALAMKAGRHAVAMAVVASLMLAQFNTWTVAAFIIVGGGVAVAPRYSLRVDLSKPAMAGAAVFFAVGLLGTLPHLSWPEPVESSGATHGPPTYLIMLDGYSRADVLDELGVNINSFIDEMERRGFDYYSSAESLHYHTHWTLYAMLTGVIEEDRWGTVGERRRVRDSLRLPAGFVSIAPGVGHVTLSGVEDIGPGGVNNFELDLVRRSLFGRLPGSGDVMIDLWRKRIERSLEATVATRHHQVFAHIMAPHTPYLYGPDGPLGAPQCWPECDPFAPNPRDHPGLRPTVEWLNQRLIETVDTIVRREPDAVVILFGDHGLRVKDGALKNYYKPLLLARTPGSSGLFADAPRPDLILNRIESMRDASSVDLKQ